MFFSSQIFDYLTFLNLSSNLVLRIRELFFMVYKHPDEIYLTCHKCQVYEINWFVLCVQHLFNHDIYYWSLIFNLNTNYLLNGSFSWYSKIDNLINTWHVLRVEAFFFQVKNCRIWNTHIIVLHLFWSPIMANNSNNI